MFSFSAVDQNISDMALTEVSDGSVWYHSRLPQMRSSHRHAELEINLVTAGRAAYLLGDRRYDLARNTLVWLFPAQTISCWMSRRIMPCGLASSSPV